MAKMAMSKEERRLRHAVHQEHYAKVKVETHRRMCVWVPRDQYEAFTAGVTRLLKRLAK